MTRHLSCGLLFVALVSLTGCASATGESAQSACTAFATSWNKLADTREFSIETAAIASERDQALATWEELSRGGAPDDITGMIGMAAEHLIGAWIATTPAERISSETSLQNAGGYIAGRCLAAGEPIALAALTLPLRPGAQ